MNKTTFTNNINHETHASNRDARVFDVSNEGVMIL